MAISLHARICGLLSLALLAGQTFATRICETGVKDNVLVTDAQGRVFLKNPDFMNIDGVSARGMNVLTKINQALKSKGVNLIVVKVPLRGFYLKEDFPEIPYNAQTARDSYNQLVKTITSAGILMPNLNEAFASTTPDKNFLRNDPHWSPFGADVAASEVAKLIQAHPAFKKVTPKEFDVKTKTVSTFLSNVDNLLIKSCGMKVTPETFQTLSVTPKDNNDSSALLAEDTPEVVVTGTSMSVLSVASFDERLKQKLSADVLNYSTSGGQTFGSLTMYLQTDHFRETPPKFLIWETAGYHRLDEMDALKQVYATIQGDCSKSNTAYQGTFNLKETEDRTSLTVNKKMSSDPYLKFTFSDKSIYDFTTKVLFTDKTEFNFRVTRNARSENTGVYYYSMLETPNKTIDRIILITGKEHKGSGSVVLCN